MNEIKGTSKVSTKSIICVLSVLLFASFFIFNISLNSSRSIIILSLCILSITIWRNHGKVRIINNPLFFPMFIWGLFCIISSVWATLPSNAISKGITIIEILGCLIIVQAAYYDFDDPVMNLLQVVQWGGFLTACYTFMKYGTTTLFNMIRLQNRLGTDFTNTNALGMLMAVTITITVHFIIYEGWKWTYLFVIPCLMLILITESRTAFIEVVFGVVMVLLSKNRNYRGRFTYLPKLIMLILGVYIVLYVLSNMPLFSGISNRMRGLIALLTGNGTVDHSALIRQKYIHAGIEQFKKTPILGIGIDNSRLITSTVEGHRTYLHNNYAEILACGGITGFFIYYSMHLRAIIEITKNRARDNAKSAICLTVLLMMLVADYGTVSYYDKDTFFLLFISYMLIMIEKNI